MIAYIIETQKSKFAIFNSVNSINLSQVTNINFMYIFVV